MEKQPTLSSGPNEELHDSTTTSRDLQLERLPLTPAIRAYLEAIGPSWLPLATGTLGLITGMATPGILFLLVLALPLTRPPVEVVVVFVAGSGLVLGVLSLLYSLNETRSVRRDLREGVYVRASRYITLVKHTGGEQPDYELRLGDRQFSLTRGQFHDMWVGLRDEAEPPQIGRDSVKLKAPTRFDARAVVSYLPHSRMLVEVQDETGGSVYRHWAIDPQPVTCPRCRGALPPGRKPQSLRQFLWGGWACARCGYATR